MKKYNFASLIRSAARRIWMWSPMRKQAIALARVPGRRPFHVQCASCKVQMKEATKPKLFAVDHIVPASEPAALVTDWNDFFERLNVQPTGLQILCNRCHDEKTERENESRKLTRNKKDSNKWARKPSTKRKTSRNSPKNGKRS